MKLSALVLVLVVAGSATAHAQPSLTPAAPPAGASDDVGDKDPTTATTLSVLGSLAPFGMIIVAGQLDQDSKGAANVLGVGGAIGLVVGPSLGHWYSGEFFTGGMAMRGIGGAVFVAGAMSSFGDCFLKEHCDSSNGDAAMLIGGILYVGGTIYDIATAGSAAREYNRTHRRGPSFQVGPTVVGAHASPGFGVAGTF
jgi:hypothetical protein